MKKKKMHPLVVEAMLETASNMDRFEALPLKLTALRIRAGVTLRDAAKEMGFTASALNSYENGEKLPSIRFAVKIAEYYKVSLDWLLGATGAKPEGT